MKPYQDKDFLYKMYVQRKMPLHKIAEHITNEYGLKTSHQTIYLWLEKFDLLKYRGKGKRASARRHRNTGKSNQRDANTRKRNRERAKKRGFIK